VFRTPRAAGSVLALVACSGCEAAGGATGDPDCAGFAFAGPDTVTWDGDDTLTVRWSPATGGSGTVTYRATVEAAEVVTTDTTARFTDLADGEYHASVTAEDEAGCSAGDEPGLQQLVGANRLVYRGELALPNARAVDGEGDHVVLGSMDGTVLLVDISDPTAPVEIGRWEDLGEVSDVELDRGLVYVATDTMLDREQPWSVRIYDGDTLVGGIGRDEDDAHTFGVAEGRLFVASTSRMSEAIYDVTDPARPTFLGRWTVPTGGSVHDQAVEGDTAWVA
jgi:hypothetical protein